MDFSKLVPLFMEGLMSFFSPCVIPIIPLYVAYLTNWASKQKEDGSKEVSYLKFMTLTFSFVAGISIIFFVAAFSSSFISQWLTEYDLVLKYVASFVIILFGLYYLGVISIPFLSKQHRLPFNLDLSKGGYLSAFLLGFLFSFGWTPCIGPMLGFAFSVSVTEGASAFIYVMSYALGFMLMFILLGIASKWVLSLLEKAKNIMPKIIMVAGILMVGMGCYVFYEAAVQTVQFQNNQATVGTNTAENTPQQDVQSDVITMEDVNFSLENKDGEVINLTDYKGKKTLIMFFGTWCGWCKKEIPELEAYLQENDDLQILLVSHPDSGINDETKESVDAFMKDYNLDYVYDVGGSVSYYFTSGSFPSNFFFNSDGTLVGQVPGAMDMNQLKNIVDTQMK